MGIMTVELIIKSYSSLHRKLHLNIANMMHFVGKKVSEL